MESEEKVDFIFVDSAGRPWRVLQTELLPPILYRWLEDSARWCPFKGIDCKEIDRLRVAKVVLPPDEAEWYNQVSRQHGGQ